MFILKRTYLLFLFFLGTPNLDAIAPEGLPVQHSWTSTNIYTLGNYIIAYGPMESKQHANRKAEGGSGIVRCRACCCSSWVSKAPFLTANSCQALVILITMATLTLQLPTVVDGGEHLCVCEFTCTCLALYSVKWNVTFENAACLTWETAMLSFLRRSSVQTLSG